MYFLLKSAHFERQSSRPWICYIEAIQPLCWSRFAVTPSTTGWKVGGRTPKYRNVRRDVNKSAIELLVQTIRSAHHPGIGRQWGRWIILLWGQQKNGFGSWCAAMQNSMFQNARFKQHNAGRGTPQSWQYHQNATPGRGFHQSTKNHLSTIVSSS